jgi:hypothetical protein
MQGWFILPRWVDSCCPGVRKLFLREVRVGIYPKMPRAPFCGILMTLKMLDGKQKPFICTRCEYVCKNKYCIING